MHIRRAPLLQMAAALFVALGFIVAPASMATAASPVRADVNAFSYDSWEVEYEIDTDAENRAIAHVTETLTARFPDYDQNRGLVRGLPIDYQGASTDPRDFSVTDESGAPVPFDIEQADGFVAVLTGDDEYVHGVQTYVISYTLSDVVLSRDDGQADEFYWDLTDYEHIQPINDFSAKIGFGPGLADRLNGDAACYYGPANSTRQCSVLGDGAEYRVSVPELGGFEGVTVAIGLEAGSVAQPPARLPSFAFDVLPIVGGVAALGSGAAGLIAVLAMRRKRATGRGVIVPEYDVPANLPPILAANIAGSSKTPIPAQLVHLAVQGTIRIEETPPKQGLFGAKQQPPQLRVMDPRRAVDDLDRMTLTRVFPSTEPNAVFTVPKSSEAFASKMRKLQAAGPAEAKARGYFKTEASRTARVIGFVGIAASALLLLLSLAGVTQRGGAVPVIGLVVGAIALVLSIISVCPHRVHTQAGAETREYLEGVREFIRVAEADRIKMLQSYEGAERFSDNDAEVIHLYERLLPYAMIFGLEKQWSQTLAVRYEQQPGHVPYWYPALAMHGIGSFESTISQFTNSLTSSVSYSSSSSGGSTGGGFSGGGGGGGFSGGR